MTHTPIHNKTHIAKDVSRNRGRLRASYRREGGREGREEGAAMLVVMLLLLATTGAATFAIHSVSFEIRAAGYGRQAMQTEHVAESGLVSAMSHVDQFGPTAILASMANSDVPPMDPYEPPLATGKTGYRVELTDWTSNPPVDVHGLGHKQPFAPTFSVDINDHFTFTGVVAGQPADGNSQFQYLSATYTSRGRTQIPGQSPTGVDTRGRHEGASDARAHGLTGPFGR